MLNTLIMDDDPVTARSLSLLLKEGFPGQIDVCAVSSSVTETLEMIEKNDVQLAFLDIDTPAGAAIVKVLEDEIPFELIFVSADSQNAVNAFRAEALDFLLKPVNPVVLREAVQRAILRIRQRQERKINEMLIREIRRVNNVPRIGLPMLQGVSFVEAFSIVRCEASGNYTCLFLQDEQRIVICRTLKDLEVVLEPYPFFFRIHKSHIINLNKISQYTRGENPQVKLDNGIELPVSRKIKLQFEKMLNLI